MVNEVPYLSLSVIRRTPESFAGRALALGYISAHQQQAPPSWMLASGDDLV